MVWAHRASASTRGPRLHTFPLGLGLRGSLHLDVPPSHGSPHLSSLTAPGSLLLPTPLHAALMARTRAPTAYRPAPGERTSPRSSLSPWALLSPRTTVPCPPAHRPLSNKHLDSAVDGLWDPGHPTSQSFIQGTETKLRVYLHPPPAGRRGGPLQADSHVEGGKENRMAQKVWVRKPTRCSGW